MSYETRGTLGYNFSCPLRKMSAFSFLLLSIFARVLFAFSSFSPRYLPFFFPGQFCGSRLGGLEGW